MLQIDDFFFLFISQTTQHPHYFSFFGKCWQLHHCVVGHQEQKPIKAIFSSLTPKEAELDCTLERQRVALPLLVMV